MRLHELQLGLRWSAYFFGACIGSATNPLFARQEAGATCVDWSKLPRLVAHVDAHGHLPAIALQQHIAYTASDSGVLIYEVKHPEAPQLVGRLDLGGRSVNGIAVAGSHAYATTQNEFWVLSLEVPENPIVRGHVTLAGGTSIAAEGTVACVAAGDRGVRILDVSNPDAPVEVASLATQGWIARLAIRGELLLVPAQRDGLLLYKIGDPRAPVLVGRLPVADGYASAVAALDGVAYLGVSRGYGQIGSLWIVDTSIPESPRLLGQADTWGPSVPAVAAAAGHAVVLTGYCVYQCGGFDLQFFDLSNPAQPRGVSDARVTGIGEDVVVAAGNAFVASSDCNPNLGGCDDPGGLSAVEWTAFAESPLAARTELSQGGFPMAVNGTRGIAADGRGEPALDLSDPSRPRAAGWVRSPVFPIDTDGLSVDGDLACVAADTNGVLVVDLSAPGQPRVVTLAYTPGNAHGVALRGPLAFVADGFAGLLVLDLSNLRAPKYLASLPTPGPARDIVVQGSFGYLVDTRGLLIVDVSQPAAPQIVGRLDALGAEHVAVEGTTAFVTTVWQSWKLLLVDVSDPTTPRLRSRLDHWTSEAVVPRGTLLYLPNSFTQRIAVLDVADASNPSPVGQCDYGGYFEHVVAGPEYLYAVAVVDWTEVVQVLRPHCAVPTASVEWNLKASVSPEGVLLLWNVRHGDFSGVHVNRAHHERSDWIRISPRLLAAGGPTRFLDSSATPGSDYDYRLEGVGPSGERAFSPILTVSLRVGSEMRLEVQSPARGSVEMRILIAKREPVRALVYDVGGRAVRHLGWGVLDRGVHSAVWDGRDDRGRAVAAGLYIVRILSASGSREAKLVLLR